MKLLLFTGASVTKHSKYYARNFTSIIMGKGKKKHSKKDQASDDLLDMAALAIKKFRKVTREIQKLSTGQKLVGGLALAAAGLAYLATVPEDKDEDSDAGQLTRPDADTTDSGAEGDNDKSTAGQHRKSRKSAKADK